ncbi:MAG TPA: hypothetical protein VHC97_19885 [Thermoanaerobaculia bacterium]|jgi:hypothetical protein|nr:hypothetical protein [Thermoanaerobaculia bacterium]
MRGVRSIGFVALIAMFLACGGGDGGGGGPTAPPPVPQIAGHWEGVWNASGLLTDVDLFLNQSGSTLTGTFATLGEELQLTGTVTPTLMKWEAISVLPCESITGDAGLLNEAPTMMSGTIDVNATRCPFPDRFAGPVTWRRAASQAKQGRPGRVEDLAAALAERRRLLPHR